MERSLCGLAYRDAVFRAEVHARNIEDVNRSVRMLSVATFDCLLEICELQ